MTDEGTNDDPTVRITPDAATPEPENTADETPAPESTADDVPTGEVITGPIDQDRIASESSRPSTKQMDLPPSGAFEPIGTDPGIPAAAEPASSPQIPVTRSAPVANKRGRRRTYALVAAAVVLLLVIAGVGSELFLRHKVTGCIQNAFGGLTGASTTVSVSRKPMLLSVFGSDVPWVQVDTSDGDATDMRLHAKATDISTDGGTVGSLTGTGYLPYKRITELSNDTGGESGAKITGIVADAKAGTIKLSTDVPIAIISVPATVTLKPTLKDGAVDFVVTEATALMFGLPADFAQPIVDQVTESMFGPLFKQIKVNEFTVGKDGVDFSFSGSDVNLKAAAESTNSSGSSGSCSI